MSGELEKGIRAEGCLVTRTYGLKESLSFKEAAEME